MIPSDLLNIYQYMSRQRILMAYHGEFSQQVVDMLLNHAKQDLQNRGVEYQTRKRTYKVLMECLENILRHREDPGDSPGGSGLGGGMVLIGGSDEGHFITIGNLVDKKDKPFLQEWLKKVENLDGKELKNKHKEVLKQGKLTRMGGAGLGILEIAIKSGNSMGHGFHDHNETHDLFILEVLVKTPVQRDQMNLRSSWKR